jgi:hypothetical protein
MFGVIYWALWLNRNDLVFNSKIIPTISTLIYNCVSLLQHWVITVKELDKGGMENLAETLTKRWRMRGKQQEWVEGMRRWNLPDGIAF